MTEEGFPDALPVGYRLHWYTLDGVLGQGGFGITYLARDTNLDRRVAIKEYLPAEIARRRSDATAHPRTEALAGRYAWGLERFLLEARTLARFDHPNIVRVHSVFEANNTAYMVMRFEEGENLAALLEREGTLPEPRLKDFLVRILDGLQLVHDAGFIHRDIKPENIYVRRDGSPVLLDFGSARQSFGGAKTMTILVAPGYAPLEQYYGDATTQGPWTDIYGLGATCYRAIAGRAPLDAIARARGVLGSAREVLPSATELGRGRYGEAFLAAIDHSLQLNERDRPQSIDEWRRELTAAVPSRGPAPAPAPTPTSPISPTPPTLSHPIAAAARPADLAMDTAPPARSGRRAWYLWGGAALAGSLAIVVAYQAYLPRPAPTLMVPAAAPITPEPARPLARAAEPPPPVPEAPSAPIVLPMAPSTEVHKVVAVPGPPPAEPRRPAPLPAVQTPTPKPTPRPEATAPAPVSRAEPAAPSPVASAPPPAAPISGTVALVNPAPDKPAPRSVRDEQLDDAEAALRRGDHAAAASMARPWAEAGVARAQLLLGRAKEGRRDVEQSDFEAYTWYALAARGGDPGARSLKDRIAAKLHPDQIQQADRSVEHWRPRAEPTAGASR